MNGLPLDVPLINTNYTINRQHKLFPLHVADASKPKGNSFTGRGVRVQFGCKQQKKIIAYSLSIAQLKALSPNYISQYIFHLSAKDSTPIEEL